MDTITKKQQTVLSFIEKFINKKGYSPSFKEIAEKFDVNVNAIQKVVSVLISKGYLEKLDGIARGFKIISQNEYGNNLKKNLVLIPVYGKVAAGEPIFIDDNIRGYLAVEKNRKMNGNEFALTIEGDSMIEKHIIEGDNVIVKKQNYADDGDVIVAEVEGEVTIKIFRKRGNDVYLQPANELHRPIRKPFKILGIMIGLTRDINIIYGQN